MKREPTPKIDKDKLAQSLEYCISQSQILLKMISKDIPKNEHLRTELNKPVFKCILALARNISKHSLDQVRKLMFNLLEDLTLKK